MLELFYGNVSITNGCCHRNTDTGVHRALIAFGNQLFNFFNILILKRPLQNYNLEDYYASYCSIDKAALSWLFSPLPDLHPICVDADCL